ncbi:hypothetical protein [Porticoccus sp.]
MTKKQLTKLCKSDSSVRVRFIAPACGSMVAQVCLDRNGEAIGELLKDPKGRVITYQNLSQAYDLCRSAGVVEAELFQVIPHDEACAGGGDVANRQTMALTL